MKPTDVIRIKNKVEKIKLEIPKDQIVMKRLDLEINQNQTMTNYDEQQDPSFNQQRIIKKISKIKEYFVKVENGKPLTIKTIFKLYFKYIMEKNKVKLQFYQWTTFVSQKYQLLDQQELQYFGNLTKRYNTSLKDKIQFYKNQKKNLQKELVQLRGTQYNSSELDKLQRQIQKKDQASNGEQRKNKKKTSNEKQTLQKHQNMSTIALTRQKRNSLKKNYADINQNSTNEQMMNFKGFKQLLKAEKQDQRLLIKQKPKMKHFSSNKNFYQHKTQFHNQLKKEKLQSLQSLLFKTKQSIKLNEIRYKKAQKRQQIIQRRQKNKSNTQQIKLQNVEDLKQQYDFKKNNDKVFKDKSNKCF